jgi:hypothetical protein
MKCLRQEIYIQIAKRPSHYLFNRRLEMEMFYQRDTPIDQTYKYLAVPDDFTTRELY